MSIAGPPRVPGFVHRARAEKVAALRARLAGEDALLVPGVPAALLGRLAEEAGFEACYVTGAGIANLQWALPDVGLISADEMAAQVARIVAATDLPVVADADDGYGASLAVMRTVRAFEQAGAAAIQIEDQAAPKRCGHFEGKRLVGPQEMVAKVRAACHARTDGTVIIARTDAIAVEGFAAARERASSYLEAGADVLFIEAPEDRAQLAEIGRVFAGVPLVANMVEGGRTPSVTLPELAGMGYRMVLFANTVLRVALQAARDALGDLRADGGSDRWHDRMLSWQERQALVHLAGAGDLEDWLASG